MDNSDSKSENGNHISRPDSFYTEPSAVMDTWLHDIDTASERARAHSIAQNELWRLQEEQREAEWELERNRYTRPDDWSGRLFSRFLGDLPANAQTIDPTPENLSRVGSYKLAAVVTMIGAIALTVLICLAMPALSVSPHLLVLNYLQGLVGSVAGTILSIIVMIIMGAILTPSFNRSRNAKFWDSAAMVEEQMFRMGCETWSTPQRVASCVSFGFVHIANWFYPLSSLLVLSVVGGIFMLIYLREYKRSNDVTLATLAATKMHATYNRLVIVYFLAAISIPLAISFFG